MVNRTTDEETNYIVTVFQQLKGGVCIWGYAKYIVEPTTEMRLQLTDWMKQEGHITKEEWERGDVWSVLTGRMEESEEFNAVMAHSKTMKSPSFFEGTK